MISASVLSVSVGGCEYLGEGKKARMIIRPNKLTITTGVVKAAQKSINLRVLSDEMRSDLNKCSTSSPGAITERNAAIVSAKAFASKLFKSSIKLILFLMYVNLY